MPHDAPTTIVDFCPFCDIGLSLVRSPSTGCYNPEVRTVRCIRPPADHEDIVAESPSFQRPGPVPDSQWHAAVVAVMNPWVDQPLLAGHPDQVDFQECRQVRRIHAGRLLEVRELALEDEE